MGMLLWVISFRKSLEVTVSGGRVVLGLGRWSLGPRGPCLQCCERRGFRENLGAQSVAVIPSLPADVSRLGRVQFAHSTFYKFSDCVNCFNKRRI